MKKNKKKITKYVVGGLAIASISAAVISAAVSCSSVNSSTSTTSQNSNSTNAPSTNLAVSGAKFVEGYDYQAPCNSKVTLSANNSNLPTGNVTYSWYCNSNIITKNSTSATYTFSVGQNANTYYVITYVNGTQEATSNKITITPSFNANDFSGMIEANTGNGMKQVSTINDTNSTDAYTLNYHVLYANELLGVTPSQVTWTINGVQSNDSGTSITVNDLKVGQNTITASTSVSIPGQSQPFAIKQTTLIINVAQLTITGSNVSNNAVTVNYDGSQTLAPTSASLASLKTAGITNQTYQWYEIANGQTTPSLLANQTSPTLKLTNITNDGTYYLVTSWKDGSQTGTLMSNKITITIGNVATLNPSIVCDNDNTSVSSPLNLGSNNINNTYKFSINEGISQSVSGTVTYTLTNTTTGNQVNLPNSSMQLGNSLSIDFNSLNLTPGDQYQLSASINVPTGNGNTTTYDSSTNPTLAFNINYNNLTISANQASNVSEVGTNNTSYTVIVGTNVTLSANTSDVYATGTPTYAWQTSTNGQNWTNPTASNIQTNGDSLTISNVGGNVAYYRLMETIGTITLYSNSIKITPITSSTITALIYSKATNATADSLNIYSASQASQQADQELYLDLKNGNSDLSLSDLTNVNIKWYVNGTLFDTNSNLLDATYNWHIGINTVTVAVSFELGGKEYSTATSSSTNMMTISTNPFTVYYYGLTISANTSKINYGQNAATDQLTISNDYLYETASYQWYVNGQKFGNASTNKPTTLPSDVITGNTTFQLYVSNKNDPSAPAIKSNTIQITVTNSTNITATITNSYGQDGMVSVYSNQAKSTSLSFKLSLNQGNNAYMGSLANGTIDWLLNGKQISSEDASDLSSPFTLPLTDLTSEGAYTLTANITLPGLSAISTSYTIDYTSQLAIKQSAPIYYDHDGTLSASITNFGNYIPNPYYFWEVNGEVVSSSTNPTYQISNLTAPTTYQLVVGNASTIAKSSVVIYSTTLTVTPSALSDLSYDIDLNNAPVSASATQHTLQSYTFSLSNLMDNAGAISATNTLDGSVVWTLSDSEGTVTTKTDNLSSSSDWSNFSYQFTNYGTYTISAKVSIGNYDNATLSKPNSITFNLTQTVADVTVSQNSTNLTATTSNSTSETYDENYNSGDLTLSASVANTTSSIKGYQWMQYVGNKWTKITTNGTSQTYQVSTKTLTTDQYKVQITLQNGQTVDSTVIAIAPQFNQSEFSAQIVPMVAKTSSNYYDSSTNTFDDYSSSATSLSLDLDYDGAPIDLVPTITWSSNATNGTFNPVTLGANTITATATITLSNQWDNNSKENVSLTPTITVPNLTINFAQVDIIDNTPDVNYGQNVSLDLTSSSKSSLTTAGLTGLTYTWYEISTPDTTTGGTQVQSSSDSTLNINDIKNDGYYYVTVSGTTPGNKTITLTSTTSIHVTVGSLSNFDLTGNVTCTNSSNTTEASPLQLTSSNVSSNVGTYNFNYDVTSSVTGFNPKVISGNVTYTLTNAKGTTITSSSSIAYGTPFNIDFSTLKNFVPGNYTLTVTGTLNDVNGATIVVPNATYTINYSTLSITSSTGTVSDNTVTVPENDSNVTLTANTADIFAGSSSSSSSSSFTYKWYTVNDGSATGINNANSSTYMIPNTGVTSQEYEVTVTVNNVTISSYLTVIPTLNSNQVSATITDNGATSLNIYSSTDANDQTLTLNIYDGKSTTPLTSSQYTDLQVVWEVNGQEVTSATNPLTLSDYAFGIGVSHVKITSLTFKVGDMVYGNSANPIALPTFTVTYYALNISTTDQTTVDYGTNANGITISHTNGTYIAGATTYEWYENGTPLNSTVSKLIPSALPNYHVDSDTSFTLVATINNHEVTSNAIDVKVSPDSMKFSASITNSDGQSSQTAYTTTKDASTSVKLSLNLEQNGSSYTTYSNLANGTLVWQVKDGANGTWQDVDGTKATPLNAALTTSYSFDATISSPGTYIYRAVITLKGISSAITSSQFTFTYTYLSATINATSTTNGEITKTSTSNTYDAYYGGDVTISAMPTGFSASNSPVYTWKVNGNPDTSITGSNGSFTIPFNYTTAQTYSLTITVDGQTIDNITSITINPVFTSTDFTTAIKATNGGTSGRILTSKTSATDVYEYDVTSNDLTFDVYYKGTLLNSINPSITWSDNVTAKNGNYSCQVAMGENNVSVTSATVMIAGKTYTLVTSSSATTLTIYNAILAITPNTSVNYDTSTTISITSDSLKSLNEVFGTGYSATYAWTKNDSAMSNEDSTSITTGKLISNATYALTVSYKDNGSTITLTSATSTVTVLPLPTLTGTITCNSNNEAITSPLTLTSSNLDNSYTFKLDITSSKWTATTAPTLTGNVTYTLVNAKGTSISLQNATVSYDDGGFTIEFDKLSDFVPGAYTLTATASINNANSKKVTVTAQYQIDYVTLSISASTGTLSGTTLSIGENQTNLTLTANATQLDNGSSYSYKWYSQVPGASSWTPINDATGKTYNVPTTGDTQANYEVVATIGTTKLTSTITVDPKLMSTPSATISGNQDIYYDANATSNNDSDTLNITLSDGTTTLTSSDYTDLSVSWTLNDTPITNGITNHGLTLATGPLTAGASTFKATITFKVGTNSYTTTATYTVNFFRLVVKASTTTIDYGMNADQVAISANGTNYIYQGGSYQWQTLDPTTGQWNNIGSSSKTLPSSLPSDTLYASTKFHLIVAPTTGYTTTIISNTIDVTVNSANITATINAPGATNNSDTVYGVNTPLTISIDKDGTSYSVPSGTSYTWSYTTPSSATAKVASDVNSTSWNTSAFLDQDGTYTVSVTITLPGNVKVTSSPFTIHYTAITITNTTAYYGYSTTLSTNITGAKSYAWYSVNSSGTVSSSSIGSDATYNITGIMANQSYQLWVTGTNGQVYKSSTYTVKVNKLTTLSLSTTYNADGYAQWFANENIPWTQSSGFNDFITQYMSGYQLDPNTTYNDFTNQKFYFSSMPSDDNLAGQAFVTVQATSTAPITLYTWSNTSGSFSSSKNIAPKGSVFTWTLPYELSQMYYSGGNVGIPFWSASNWWNSNAYKDNFPTPFGLSIGSATNPTSYSGTLSGNDNGVILIAYGDSSGSPYTPPSKLSNAYPGNNTSNPSIGSATTFANSTNATTSNDLVLTSESNSANISSNSVITFLTNATTNAGAVTTSNFTNDGNAITPTCTYTIKKGSTTIISGASASLIGDEAMFNYLFDEPGQYTITVTYSVPNLDGTLSQSETYYVNYNQVAITASNTNPKVGSTVTLSANNDGMHVATTDATYQWQQYTDGGWNNVGTNSSTYKVDIDVYNATYEYRLEETVDGTTYTSAPVTLTPNDSGLTLSASISNSNAINGDIGITSSTNETFDLSATFNGETYDTSNPLSSSVIPNASVTITWYVNGSPISTDNNKWSITYDATSQGTYAIKAVIAVTAYGDSDIPSATSNTITINYTSEMGTLNIDTPTSSSPYVYNKSESKLVIWGNGTNTPDTTPVGFSVTGLSATNASDYEVEFINGSKTNDVALSNLAFNGSTGTFTLPVSDFDGYTSLKLINTKTNTTASQTIAYTYLPQKPWFEIEPGSSITVANPQITLVPNENLGSATLGAISAQDLSFSLDVNGTTIGITPVSGSSTNATISIEGASLTYDNFYTVSVNNNVSYQVNGQTITGAAYVISFDATKFKQLISYADYSGTWTTIQVNTTLSGVTLDGEPITGTNPLTQTIGYANTNNSTNDMYTAGVYWNNVPVTSVPQGASNVTLQLKGTIPSGATIQWLQVTSGGAVDLTDATSTTYDLSTANLQTSGMLTYEAQITSDGNTITTNQCTVNVTDLGQATINIEGQTASQIISSTDSTYDLTSGTTYQIQTSNQTGVTLNDTQSGVNTYYQWQYKSNSVILDDTASNSTWTNLGNATSTYQPYSYTAVPMYSVSFRLVVFTDSSTPTTFNAQTNTQYIISNVINTYAAFNCSFDVVTSTPTVKEGTAVTYTLNPSDQEALMLLVKNCRYQYQTYNSTTSSYNQPTWFYPVTVTWYYKLSSASSYTTAATLSITIDNGKLAFAGANYDSLSYTFSGSDFSTAGTYDIYAKINFTDNFNTSSSNTANLTVTGTNSSLNYNYETYMENAIANWINSGTNAVENTSLNGTQSQSTFNDFIQQNGAGYEVHATYQDFDNYKVSFTSTPSADSSELGNNEWLTITATATTTINMYYWQSSGGWGASGGTTVASGNQFVWTLPYALSDITYSSSTTGGMLEMALNSTYSNATSNEDLPVPFGLSVGTSTAPTSISKTWSYTSKTSGVLANNYGTNGESFTLPSPWVVPYNQDDAFVNLFASQLNSNATNFGNTGSSASTFITNLITGNEAGFKLPTASYSDFSNWYVTWNSTAIQGYYFLTVSAFNNTAITMDYWDNPAGKWATLSTIPTGSYFTWTFPYYKSIISFDSSNGTLSNAGMPQSDYFDSNTGAPNSNWTTPLGLSIGSPTSPDSITSGTLYTTGSLVKAGDDTTHSGVIGWNYGSTTTSLTFSIPPQTTSSTTTAVLNNNSLLFSDELLTNWNK